MMRRILRPEDLFYPTQGHPVETLANLEKIPIRENGEPLVELRAVCPALGLIPRRPEVTLRAREGVAERLNQAQCFLSETRPGYRLGILEAWRDLGTQARWHRLVRLAARLLHPTWPAALIREAANKYVAATDALAPAPHTTGGAIDLTLITPDGRRLRLGPWGNLASARTAYPHLPAETKEYRALLCAVMSAAGFSNYEEEWWHWSYGDCGWALRTHQPAALYGRIT